MAAPRLGSMSSAAPQQHNIETLCHVIMSNTSTSDRAAASAAAHASHARCGDPSGWIVRPAGVWGRPCRHTPRRGEACGYAHASGCRRRGIIWSLCVHRRSFWCAKRTCCPEFAAQYYVYTGNMCHVCLDFMVCHSPWPQRPCSPRQDRGAAPSARGVAVRQHCVVCAPR